MCQSLAPKRAVLLFVALLWATWAASIAEAAHLNIRAPAEATRQIPSTSNAASRKRQVGEIRSPNAVSFRDVKGRGFLVEAWVNGVGPYTFAIDTGAGITLIGDRLAAAAKLPAGTDGPVSVGGLSGVRSLSGREAIVHALALGDPDNLLPA